MWLERFDIQSIDLALGTHHRLALDLDDAYGF